MKKLWIVARYEIVSTITRRSFILVTISIPILILAMIGLMLITDMDEQPQQTSGEAPPAAEVHEEPIAIDRPLGFVDAAGLIQGFPADVPTDRLIRYPDEASARAALEAGTLQGYYLIPADYLTQGSLIYVDPAYNIAQVYEQAGAMRWTLFYNLAGADQTLAAQAIRPMTIDAEPVVVATSAPAAEDIDACQWPVGDCDAYPTVDALPTLLSLAMYMLIIMSSSLLFSAITEEKKNQVMEVVLSSISPLHMLAGKTLGLALVSLGQFVVWGAMTFVAMRLAGPLIVLPPGFSIPLDFILWFVVFFLLGYALYAALMAGAGALVPDIKQASGASFLVILPLIIGYVPLPMILDDILNLGGALRDGTALVFSIFPFTSPVSMVMRLSAGPVPFWQILLSAVLLGLTSILVLRAVARMFRAQTLLTGQPFSAGAYFRALLGRPPMPTA